MVVYPDTASLAGSIGWNRNESAMGVYWAGSIRILSPGEWIKGDALEKQFKQEGPMVHEFTHLMVDEITKGTIIAGGQKELPSISRRRLQALSLPILLPRERI